MKIVNRIKKSDDFALVIKKGTAYRCPAFRIHRLETSRQLVRVGLSVSTKVGNAIVRAKIKRRLRAICDSLLDYNNLSFDLVLIAQKEITSFDYESLFNFLSNYLNAQIGTKK